MSKYGDMKDRAKRFVLLHDYYGHAFEVCQNKTHLPERLAKALRILFFGDKEDSKTTLPLECWNRAIDLALEEYRSYFRERMTQRREEIAG